VQDALKSFFESDLDLSDPDNLLGVPLTFTRRKVFNVARKHKRRKRDIDREQTGPVCDVEDIGSSLCSVEDLVSGPGSEEATILLETIESLSESEQQLVKWRLDGYTYEEIAKELSCSEKSVQRAMERLRQKRQSANDKWTFPLNQLDTTTDPLLCAA
jgi:RNA polymerase sigma factor (sigma-70 family)